MEIWKLLISCVWFLCIASVSVRGQAGRGSEPCNFPAIYNFGDSNSDTGGISAAFLPVAPPNGESFFGRPAGRACDGRLVIDFIAENSKLPYLHAYLDSLGASFRHGANFATAGSCIRPQNASIFHNGASPFSLNVQVWQFEQFKARTSELFQQAKNPSEKAYLPNPDEFSKAIYTFEIGQNDLIYGSREISGEQVRATFPNTLDQFSLAIQKIYQLGARTFWIHNAGPIGCLPSSRFYFSAGPGTLDQHGCIKPVNDLAIEFNRQMKEQVAKWRGQYGDAAFTYVDMYTAKYQLISDAKNQGFDEPLKICCGRHDQGKHVCCGQRDIVKGTEIYGASCGNPSMYISWDGIHFSQAANHWIANRLLSGSGALTDPPVPFSHACRKYA